MTETNPGQHCPGFSYVDVLVGWCSKGPLAHLVERIHGMDEATGSIPVRSKNYEVIFFRTEREGVGKR